MVCSCSKPDCRVMDAETCSQSGAVAWSLACHVIHFQLPFHSVIMGRISLATNGYLISPSCLVWRIRDLKAETLQRGLALEDDDDFNAALHSAHNDSDMGPSPEAALVGLAMFSASSGLRNLDQPTVSTLIDNQQLAAPHRNAARILRFRRACVVSAIACLAQALNDDGGAECRKDARDSLGVLRFLSIGSSATHPCKPWSPVARAL
ncbi:hypothetical protein ACN47E_005414 [Coniothyrium glycines]